MLPVSPLYVECARVPQLIALTLVMLATAVFNVRWMGPAIADGNWGDPVGVFVSAFLCFHLVHVAIYLIPAAIRRYLMKRDTPIGYAGSRINYLTLLITLLIVVAAATQRAQSS